MEVVNDNCALLSNCEVLSLLNEVKFKDQLNPIKNLSTIAYESIKYLEESPIYGQTSENVTQFLEQCKHKFRLTKAEKLQILNQTPNTLVELQLLIEENEERFSEDAMTELLNLIRNTLCPNKATDGVVIKTNDNSDSDDQ